MRTPWFQKQIETSATPSIDNSEESLTCQWGIIFSGYLKFSLLTKIVKIELSLHSFPWALYKSRKSLSTWVWSQGYVWLPCNLMHVLMYSGSFWPLRIHLPHLVTGASLMLVVLNVSCPASGDCSFFSLIRDFLSLSYSITELPFDTIDPKTKMARTVQWRN